MISKDGFFRTLLCLWNKVSENNCRFTKEDGQEFLDKLFAEGNEFFDLCQLDKVDSFLLNKIAEQEKEDTTSTIEKDCVLHVDFNKKHAQ